MRVRLIRKLALKIDGIDLSNHEVGDTLDLPEIKAALLIAEGWAVEEPRFGRSSRVVAFRGSSERRLDDRDDDLSQVS
jgi:hypothetical protein